MPAASYERIPLEGGEPELEDHHVPQHVDSPNDHYPPGLVKPQTYYDEGEFDPPSSDEEEDVFLEKTKHTVDLDPALDGHGDRMNDDVELVIGGHKVALHMMRLVHMLIQRSEIPKTLVAAMSGHLSRRACCYCRTYWYFRRLVVQGHTVPSARQSEDYHGAHIQRHVQCADGRRAVDSRG